MKKIVLKNKVTNQKRRYFVILVFIIVGIFMGFIYPFFLSSENKEILDLSVNSYFDIIKNNNYISLDVLKNVIPNNIFLLITIWILGISIIGLIFVIFILLYKSFILGFSFSSIVYTYGIKGILGGFIYVFPASILELIIYILIGFYSISFSIKLFSYIFLKNNINLSGFITKYFKILCITIMGIIVTGLYQVYVLPILIKLFTNLL